METTKSKLTMPTTHAEHTPVAQMKSVSRATNDVQHHNALDSVSVEVRNRRLSDVSQLGCHDAKNVLDNKPDTKKTAAAFCNVQKNHTTPALGVDVMLTSENVSDGQNKSGVFIKNDTYFLLATTKNFEEKMEFQLATKKKQFHI